MPLLSLALLLSVVAGPLRPAPEIVWIDIAGAPAASLREAQEEAGRVLAEVGLYPRWRRGAPSDVLAAGEVTVVLLPRDAAARPGGPPVLGACHRHASAPRVWVYLSSLRWTLDLPAEGPLTPFQAMRVGRAMGRIVAHEVIHAVAPGLRHASSGVMAASLGRAALLGPYLGVDTRTRQRLLVGAALRASSPLPRS